MCPRCSHRHRWRHRVYLFQGLRLCRLRLRYRRPCEGRAPPGLARQHLLDDDVVGPLQHRTDLGWDRRVGRQDRVQVGAGGGDPLKVVRRGEPVGCRRGVMALGKGGVPRRHDFLTWPEPTDIGPTARSCAADAKWWACR
ncbi:hypothetical protein [uncultured Actinomyces sp.]|uniref:hypothetical protein n=1 Tax=uncultured Actinomyces sp. TaxID=249061 RepID=UPI0028D529F1|nr:hypothetical protein [uncultured Actinomyces sp.]